MIISSIESNNLHVKQIESIQVNLVAQIPPPSYLAAASAEEGV